MISTRANLIRELNDHFRTRGPAWSPDPWDISKGIYDLGPKLVASSIFAVARSKAFRPDLDPFDEHNLGFVLVDEHLVFWKIDYYDPSRTTCSEDPSHPLLTRRVMSIMPASEY